MHQAQLPPQRPMRPWYGAGEITERLPQVVSAYTARIPPLDPSEDPTGAVGQPYRMPLDPRVGMPRMSEETLIAAYHRCSCAREPERMAWEEWSPGQWVWFRRRQRVMAQRAVQREARKKETA